MAEECSYSFHDLFRAAHERDMTASEKHAFIAMRHEERNIAVKGLARKAGWGTKDKKGSDGEVYTAFCPTWTD